MESHCTLSYCVVRPLCLLLIYSWLWSIPSEWRQWSLMQKKVTWWYEEFLSVHTVCTHTWCTQCWMTVCQWALQGRDDEEGEPERKRALAEEAEEAEKHRWRSFPILLIKWTVKHASRGDQEGYCYKTGTLVGYIEVQFSLSNGTLVCCQSITS